ncbi:phage integrase SAM-like domain-containing protein [beta proteobacterium MWH-UniP1]
MRHYAVQMLCAANDENFYAIRCRTLPRLDTMTQIPGYPTKLKIFQTNASRFWQVRCFFPPKAIIRSLRTTSKREAIAKAKLFYDTELVKRGLLASDISKRLTHSVEEVAALLFDSEAARLKRDEITKQSYVMLTCRIRKQVLPFFRNVAVEDIDYTQVAKFLAHLSQHDYRPMTIKQYMSALRRVLTCAHDHGWVERLPKFPQLKIHSSARGSFAVAEYRQLLRTAKQLRQINPKPITLTHRSTRGGIYTDTEGLPWEFAWLIGFMVNSFVRPVDVKVIQHKHVQVIRGEHCYLRLVLPETKRHKSQVITLPAALHIYEQLKQHFERQGLAGEEDYLFLPQVQDRAAAMWLLERYFGRLLDATGLRFSGPGGRRTLYSLRHSAITFRLLYGKGIDLLTLARNARTSLEMVDKFYASELSAEMNVAMLHSRR